MKKAVLWLTLLALAALVPGWHPDAAAETSETAQATDGRAYFDLGVFAYEDGDYEQALNLFRMALRFDPESAPYHHWLGRALTRLEREDAAEDALNRAEALGGASPGLAYDLGMLYFRRENDARASDYFMRAAETAPDDVLARYYAGLSLFRQGRYEEAAPYFVAAADKSPDLRARGYYYAGVSYKNSGQSDRALEMFDRVKADPNAGQFADPAREWADAIREGGAAEKPWRVYVKLGRRYDDNIPLDPEDTEIFTEESDWGTHFYFAGRYDFPKWGRFRAGAGYRHYWMAYDDLDDYNLSGGIAHLHGDWNAAPFIFRMTYEPAYYWSDGDSYLRRHRLGPDLFWRATSTLTARLGYRYSDNDYFIYKDRSGHDQTVFSELHLTVLGGAGRVFGRLEYEDRSAEAADREYAQWLAGLGGTFDLPWKLEAGVLGEYRAKNYDAADRFFGVEREDDRYSLALSLSRPVFYQWLGVLAEYRYMWNESNINDYEYTRNQFTLSVTADF